MAIIGGRVIRMEAKRIEENAIESINLNVNITNVTSEKNILRIAYSSRFDYAPKVAELNFDGELFMDAGEEKKAKEFIEAFKKTKALPESIAEEVVTAVNYASATAGTLLSFAMNINAPINVPRAKIVKKEPAKAG